MEIVEEIRKLAKFVELDRKIEEKRKAEAEFTEWLRENRVPRRTGYYSDYLGDDTYEEAVIIFDEEGGMYSCPQKVHLSWASNHIEDHYEEGKGVTDFIIELISKGITPVKFRIIEKSIEEINREIPSTEYRELEGTITEEHLKIIKEYLLRELIHSTR